MFIFDKQNKLNYAITINTIGKRHAYRIIKT